jgi:hypothetical protein
VPGHVEALNPELEPHEMFTPVVAIIDETAVVYEPHVV